MKNIFKKYEKPFCFLFFRLCGYLLYSSPLRRLRQRTFDPRKLRKVLINMSRPGMGMGDLIQLTPLVRAICKASPGAQISLLVSGVRCPDVVSLFPSQVEIIPMPANYYFYGHRQWLSFVLRHIRPKKFDLIIHQYMEHWLSVSCLSIFGGSSRTISYTKHLGRAEVLPNNIGTMVLKKSPPDEVPFLYNEELADCFQYRGTWKTVLKVSQDAEEKAEKALSKFGIDSDDLILGLHPGCTLSHLFRRWPVNNFIAVAKKFRDELNGKIIVFGGPDEEARARKIQRRLSGGSGFAAGHIKDVSALIKRCSVFLTNDSGFMHISQAVGVPAVAIYGPTRPAKFDSLYNNGSFIHLRGDVSCEPCLGTQRVKECGSDTPACITSVSADKAYAALKSLLINTGFRKRKDVCHSL